MSPKNFDLALLRMFVTVVEVSTMKEAGEIHGRTQAAVSQQMDRLEQDLDVTLFKREGRRKRVTGTGMVIYYHAKNLIRANDYFYESVAEIKNN